MLEEAAADGEGFETQFESSWSFNHEELELRGWLILPIFTASSVCYAYLSLLPIEKGIINRKVAVNGACQFPVSCSRKP
jgi:hypothetical protein